MTPPTDATDWIALTPAPLDAAAAVRFVTDPAAGGIDLFLGITRAERNAAGHDLLALDYEAYADMAIARLKQLAAEARQRWPIAKLAVLHRTGRVPVGEASVAVAVASPHRAEAFDACRFLIDELKKDVPIWKREVWAEGDATWVHPG